MSKKNVPQDETAETIQTPVEPEQTAPETEAEAPVIEPEPVRAEDSLKKELAEKTDQYLRLMAEYENFRRRTQREKDSIYPQATATVVGKFLPIIDSFDRALDAPCSDDAFKKGLEMIFQNFSDVLTALGGEEFGAIGDTFDPTMHNGVAKVENPDFGENEISDVYQKGYKLGDKILRTAMVVVAN